MKDQFSHLARRTRRWKFADGTTELLLGGFMLWGGLAFNAPSPLLTSILVLVGMVVIVLGVEALQRKYVYPRAGYVEFRETTRRGMWKPLLAALTIMLAFIAVFWWFMVHRPDDALAWIASFLGIFLGLVFLYCALAFGFRRLAVIGLLSLTLGLLFSPLVLPPEALEGYLGIAAMAVYFILVGLALLVSGGLAFRAFLRNNPLLAESADEP
ncbi:MAG: hypothetical protein ABWK53_02600 [Anaerolineales bacterium]